MKNPEQPQGKADERHLPEGRHDDTELDRYPADLTDLASGCLWAIIAAAVGIALEVFL